MREQKTVQLLHVEDDTLCLMGLSRAFKAANIANPVCFAHDGIEALEMLRGTNGRPRLPRPFLILLDLNMPRMDGIHLVMAIRADPDLHETIIFILTTSSRAEDKNAAYKLNVSGYILKERAGDDFLKLFSLVDSYWRIVEMP